MTLLFKPTFEQLDKRNQGVVLHHYDQHWRVQGWWQGRCWGRACSQTGKDLDAVLVEIPREVWALRLRPPESA